jgi:hypothetical protein
MENDMIYKKAVDLLESLNKTDLIDDVIIANELKSILIKYCDITKKIGEFLVEVEIPLILTTNGCFTHIFRYLRDSKKQNILINKLAGIYSQNTENINILYTYCNCLSFAFIHNYSYASSYYYGTLEEIFNNNPDDNTIKEIFSRCTSYGFYQTIDAIKYNKNMFLIFSQNKNNISIAKDYADVCFKKLKYADSIYTKRNNMKEIENIYLNGITEVANLYSDSLYNLILNENSSELMYIYLNKMKRLEKENCFSYEYLNAYIHYISHDLMDNQKLIYTLYEYCSNRIFKSIKITFRRNHMILYFEEDMDNDEGESFYEGLEIYIVKPNLLNSIIKKTNVKPKEINNFSQKEMDFYNLLSYSNEKIIFQMLLSIYTPNDNTKDIYSFVKYLDEFNIEYMHAEWSR